MAKNSNKVLRFDDIRGIVRRSAEIYAEKPAFVIKRKSGGSVNYENKSYRDFLYDINCFGTGLYSLGLQKKRIAVFGRNRYEWAVAHFAVLLGAMVSVPLDKELKLNELEDSLIRSRADAIIYDEKYSDLIGKIKEYGKTDLTQYICMSECGKGIPFSNVLKKGRELIEGGDKSFESCEIDPDELAILLFTSGTTDKSKAVMLCQRGIAYNVYDMQISQDIRPGDVNIAFLPFHHIFGSTGLVVMAACGVKTVFTDGLRYVKKNLKEYGVTVFVSVPIILESLCKGIEKEIRKQGREGMIRLAEKLSGFFMKLHIDLRRLLYSSVLNQLGGKLRLVISGGAPLDTQTSVKLNKMGICVVQGYGLTETSPVISAENKSHSRLGSVGVPMNSVEVCIADKDENGIGEIRVKGKNVMLGYYENDEATKGVMKDGWFCTGDLGYIDDDGYIFITGRKKDVIVLQNGKKVFPEELETLINRIPGVSENFVYGDYDSAGRAGKILCKVVYDKSAFTDIEDEIYRKIWNEVK